MAFPTKALLAVAALAGGAALLGKGGKSSSKGRLRPSQGGPKQIQLPTQMPGWCKELHKGTLPQERAQQIVDAVIAADDELQPWDGKDLGDARERAFAITMTVMGQLCPGVDLPKTQQALPNYLEQKPAWWKALYSRVHPQAWHLTTVAA